MGGIEGILLTVGVEFFGSFTFSEDCRSSVLVLSFGLDFITQISCFDILLLICLD